MAALAPPPYRPPAAPPASTAPSSTSMTNSATPKKQEQLAAGRRRLEEFKRKKAAEKGKKTSASAAAPAAPVVSDQPAQNVPDRVQFSVPPAVVDSAVPISNQIDSNGHVSEILSNDDLNPVETTSSASAALAASSAIRKENTGAIPLVSENLRSFGEVFRQDPQVTAVPSGGGINDGSSIRDSNANNVRDQTGVKLSTTTSGKADGESGSSSSGHDSENTNRVGTALTAPLGAARPLFVPPPPPARKEIFSAITGHEKPETTKNPVALHPSPFNSLSSSSSSIQGFDTSFNSSGQKPNGGGLVMLDRKLVPSDSARKGPLPQSGVSEAEQESNSAKARLPPNGGARTDNQTDGTTSTSALSGVSHNTSSNSLTVKSESGKGSENPPAMSRSFSTFLPPSSLGTKTPMRISETSSSLHSLPPSDSAPPKFLPLPPPLSRPPISTAAFKPEYFAPVFKNVSDSGSSSSSSSTLLSSTAPSTSSFLDNALPRRPSAPPSTLHFPGLPLSAINAIHENGNAEAFVNPLAAVLPPLPSSTSIGQILTQPLKVPEPADQSRQPWPSSSGGDDFGMLEQHIEDLTQEKFSLQRGLDAARALTETLAQENSALTEDFNNQGALVNDLKGETERQQGEIRAQAVVVKTMKVERDKAVQDCKAAVERSQALAAEVIALEEKVLRARSQELKLQREMELLSTETESQKRQIASLDKDRANLKTLMEALQEEKGLLQTQIRKATADGSAGDLRMSGSGVRAKADVSTSTSDDFDLGTFFQGSAAGRPLSAPSNNALGFEPLEQQRRLPLIIPSLPSRPLPSPGDHAGQASGSFSLANELGFTSQFFPSSPGNLSGRGLNLGPVSSVIPADQAATIGNINNLVTELAEEKEALLKALKAESVGAAELRTLNSELSHKLEVQTQRLELAVAQSMAANDGTPRLGSTYAVSRVAPEYIDEEDEVVDRVLGWIMQLFPSGSSRRKRL